MISWKEERRFEQNKNVPTKRIDIDLDLANKRLAEIRQILFRDYEIGCEGLLRRAIKEYKLRMDDAVLQANGLSEIEKNNYLIKIIAFFKVHNNFLSTLTNKDSVLIYDFEDLAIFIKAQIAKLSGDVWMSRGDNEKTIIFNIENENKYDLIIENQDILPQKILLDGKEINNTNDLIFTKGIRKVTIIYPVDEGLISQNELEEDNQIKLIYGEKRIFSIPNYNNKY